MSVDFDTVPDEIVTEHAFDWPPEPLGAGGMAVVYQARDRRLPREVILKKPRTHSNLGDELAPDLRRQLEQRLASEALILAQLQHPSIVTIYEVGRSGDGAPFCVLERVEGRSLGDLLEELEAAEAEDGQPRTRERLELVSNLLAIAEALACAHERSIVHRDVTPYNILLGPRGEATLIDWGIAKDLRTQRLDDELALDEMRPEDAAALAIDRRFATICAGTPPYVSLEQAEGKPAHPSYDIYTFGATLYHVVAGRPPFQLDKLDVFLDDLRQGEPPPPASPQDPELSGIIARAMAPREDRFTANELVRALKEYLTGELVFSHRYSSTGRLVRWVRKRRSTAVALVAVVLAAVFAALTWSAMSERAQRQAREAAEARAEASEALAAAAAREREVAEAEKARAEAEKARAETAAIAADKEREAREAQAAADRADRNSQRYKDLKGIAEAKRRDAETARATATTAASEAEGRATAARAAADQARAEADRARQDAERTKTEAAHSIETAARERDQAVAAANRERDQAVLAAVRERDDAVRDRDDAVAAAAKERDQARRERDEAIADRDRWRQRAERLEDELGGPSGPTEPAPAPEPAPPPP